MGSESPRFRRSSFCNAGGCVEVAEAGPERILLRGTGAPNLIPLAFSPRQWSAFVEVIAPRLPRLAPARPSVAVS
jgi:uncharacterized protein DUF397